MVPVLYAVLHCNCIKNSTDSSKEEPREWIRYRIILWCTRFPSVSCLLHFIIYVINLAAAIGKVMTMFDTVPMLTSLFSQSAIAALQSAIINSAPVQYFLPFLPKTICWQSLTTEWHIYLLRVMTGSCRTTSFVWLHIMTYVDWLHMGSSLIWIFWKYRLEHMSDISAISVCSHPAGYIFFSLESLFFWWVCKKKSFPIFWYNFFWSVWTCLLLCFIIFCPWLSCLLLLSTECNTQILNVFLCQCKALYKWVLSK